MIMEVIKGVIVILGFAYLFAYPVIELIADKKRKKEISELKEKVKWTK